MLTYLTQRILIGILTIWAVSVISFVIIQLPPGDFVDTYIAKLESQNTNVSQEEAALMRAQYGLDDPGVIEAVLRPHERGFLLTDVGVLRLEFRDVRVDEVAGGQLDDDERDHRDGPDRENADQDPLRQVGQHVFLRYRVASGMSWSFTLRMRLIA